VHDASEFHAHLIEQALGRAQNDGGGGGDAQSGEENSDSEGSGC
jgi:hypothetical protein